MFERKRLTALSALLAAALALGCDSGETFVKIDDEPEAASPATADPFDIELSAAVQETAKSVDKRGRRNVAFAFILIFVYLWKFVGTNSIIYVAGIAGMDKEIFEAAQLDGASKVKQILHITVPMLKPTIITLTLMAVGRIFYSDFGLFYQVPANSGRLFAVTQTIDTYVYRGLMESNDVGMSAAAALYQSVVGFILVIGANALVRKIDRENALF